MDFTKMYASMMAAFMATVLTSCSPGHEPVSEMGGSSSTATQAAAEHIAERDVQALIYMSRDQSRTDQAIKELRALSWKSLPPKDRTDLETVIHNNLRVQISTDYGDYIKLLGQLYVDEELSKDEYVNAMLLIDAFLAGIMSSHETIRNHEIHPDIYALQTVLTFAPLMRLGIAQELEKYGLEMHAVLSEEQRKQLKVVTRDMDYESFDQFP